MTAMTLISCGVVLASVAGAIAVLPWSDLALEESSQAWAGLWNRVTGRAVPAPTPARRSMQFADLALDASVQPPRPATVWSPPCTTPQRRCA